LVRQRLTDNDHEATVLTSVRILRNLYRDSITLLQIATSLGKRDGIGQAGLVMASEANIALMTDSGLIDAAPEAGPNDLLIIVQGEDQKRIDAALDAAQQALEPRDEVSGTEAAAPVARSLVMALGDMPDATLAMVATPGAYAAAEARKALNLGLHVMMFSDNVDLADEIALKTLAHERNLMMMGPDCGTAIINGVPLGFANVVRRGDIGLVAASGTGLQQVSCLIHMMGSGVSQAIGVGGRDLKSEVGGITMLQGLDALAKDPDTKVIVLISKPPAPDIADRLIEAAAKIDKPVVINFLGAERSDKLGDGLLAANTLEDAARQAVALSSAGKDDGLGATKAPLPSEGLAGGQRFVRALYTGGTFCYEALTLFDAARQPSYSNVPLRAEQTLADAWKSQGHTILDLGEDLFTRGRSHPMIDPRLRQDRVLEEAADADVAVILFDIVLGYGAHPDPAGVMAASIVEARAIAERDGRAITFIGSVCGTDGDPQGLERQIAMLREAGATLLPSNARAVENALALIAELSMEAAP
jgi:succinyl-CoA synthetase alpha subunit